MGNALGPDPQVRPSDGEAIENAALSRDEQTQILILQQRLLEAVAKGGNALDIARQVCSLEEKLLPNSVGTVMLLDEARERLNVFAAPSVPAEGVLRLNGLRPGPGNGSCGNAVFSCKPQFVQNTFEDPRWSNLRQLATDFGLCACWSMPIFSASGQVIGSFALSSFEHRLPSGFHRALLEIGASIVGIVLDRAKVREHLRLYEKFYANSAEGMMITDAAQKIVSVNASFLRVFGYAEEDVIGQTPRMLSSGRHDAAYYQDMWRGLSRAGQWRGEIWNRRQNGEIFPELLSIATLTDGEGRITHYIGLFSDLSDRIRAEADLREKNRQLLRSNEDLERFAYAASHDLQTPLRNMVHFAQLLDRRYRGRLDADADDFIDIIVEGGKRMTNLVRDLLDYSRAGSGDDALTAVDTAQAVRLALQNLDLALRESGAHLDIGPLPRVMGEPSLIAELFQNLIQNAIDYRAAERTPRIVISAQDGPDGFCRITVADNGIGIEPRYFGKIFELFQRVSPPTSDRGTGIGLSLCRRLVHRFGGEIGVESTPGQGSAFHVTLRRATD